jgi:hypothetical protein
MTVHNCTCDVTHSMHASTPFAEVSTSAYRPDVARLSSAELKYAALGMEHEERML